MFEIIKIIRVIKMVIRKGKGEGNGAGQLRFEKQAVDREFIITVSKMIGMSLRYVNKLLKK